MQKIDLLNCPFCGGKAETLPLYKCDSYGNHERLWYSECGECFARSGYYNTEGEAAIAWNTRASGWIPCNEMLPEVGDMVLVAIANGDIDIAILDKDKSGFSNGFWYNVRNVTHWMPLPEEPEVK